MSVYQVLIHIKCCCASRSLKTLVWSLEDVKAEFFLFAFPYPTEVSGWGWMVIVVFQISMGLLFVVFFLILAFWIHFTYDGLGVRFLSSLVF